MVAVFGRGKKIDGEAHVMAATPVPGGISDMHHSEFDFVLDVRPSDGAPFRTTVRQKVRDIVHPKAGDVVRVTIDPKHDQVHLEIDGDPRYAAQDKQIGLDFITRQSVCAEEAEQLRTGGTATTAVVDEVTVTEILQVTGAREFAVRATVQAPNGGTFAASFALFMFGRLGEGPAVGETINVCFDPADRSRVRAPIMWRQSAASQIASARWSVPAECPECGARVDQSAAASAAHPACAFCHAPLPCTPV